MVLGAPGAHGHAISFEEGCTESVFGLPSALSVATGGEGNLAIAEPPRRKAQRAPALEP